VIQFYLSNFRTSESTANLRQIAEVEFDFMCDHTVCRLYECVDVTGKSRVPTVADESQVFNVSSKSQCSFVSNTDGSVNTETRGKYIENNTRKVYLSSLIINFKKSKLISTD